MQFSRLDPSRQAGQRLMIGFSGTTLDDELKYAIDTLNVGGLILFSRNIQSPDQVQELCAAAQAYAARCGNPPLFVAIDQEGGVVARLKAPFTQFAGNPSMKNSTDARHFAHVTARELERIGVNMNMAPVLDVAPALGPSIMAQRVFGSDPLWVAQMGTTVIEHLQAAGIMAVGKHFPGIGRTVLDSHENLPELDIDAQTLSQSDLIPFRAAIQSDVCGIMLSHIRYGRIDPQWPASLSVTIVQDLLRATLGYDGLVLTDDLDMGAIAKHYALPDIIRQCLYASVDIILICHAGPKIAAAYEQIVHHMHNSEALALKNDACLARIQRAKAKFLDKKIP